MNWTRSPYLGLDLEATGTDVDTDRIVSAALWRLHPDGRALTGQFWTVDPGIEVPAASTQVHGLTTEYVRKHGTRAARAAPQIAVALTEAAHHGWPLVVFNAPYDLSLLDRELRRHTSTGLWTLPAVLDPLILDRAVCDRPGKRTLAACCEHYGVELAPDEAHQAGPDALAAGRLLPHLLGRHPDLADMSLRQLQTAQTRWYRIWATERRASLQARDRHDEAAQIRTAWPVRPFTELEEMRAGRPVR